MVHGSSNRGMFYLLINSAIIVALCTINLQIVVLQGGADFCHSKKVHCTSRGSVATHLRCVDIFTDEFITNLLPSPVIKAPPPTFIFMGFDIKPLLIFKYHT